MPAILGEIGPAAERAIPALLRGIAHTNLLVRHNAVVALGRIHAQPELVVPELIKCFDDKEAFVRAEAAGALGAFGKEAQSAVPALLELRRNEALRPGPASGKAAIMFTGFVVASSWGASPSPSFNADVVGCSMEALNQIDSAAAAKADLK